MRDIDIYMTLVDRIRNQDMRAKFSAIGSKSGTVKKWFENNHGKNVLTIQANFDSDGDMLTNVWFPGVRGIDHGPFSYRRWSGFHYRGLRVVAATDELLVARTDTQIMGYLIVE